MYFLPVVGMCKAVSQMSLHPYLISALLTVCSIMFFFQLCATITFWQYAVRVAKFLELSEEETFHGSILANFWSFSDNFGEFIFSCIIVFDD